MDFTDEHIAEIQAALEKDFGRPFSRNEAIAAWHRLDLFYRLVTKQLPPSNADRDQAADC